MNVMAQWKFELVNYDSSDLRFNDYTTRTPLPCMSMYMQEKKAYI